MFIHFTVAGKWQSGKKSLNSNIWTFYVASTDEAIRQLVNLI